MSANRVETNTTSVALHRENEKCENCFATERKTEDKIEQSAVCGAACVVPREPPRCETEHVETSTTTVVFAATPSPSMNLLGATVPPLPGIFFALRFNRSRWDGKSGSAPTRRGTKRTTRCTLKFVHRTWQTDQKYDPPCPWRCRRRRHNQRRRKKLSSRCR